MVYRGQSTDDGMFRQASRALLDELSQLLTHVRPAPQPQRHTGKGPRLQAAVWQPSGNPQWVEAAYEGHCTLAGTTLAGTPETLFSMAAPPGWRQALMDLSWLADCAASPKALHAGFAARLLQCWSGQRRPGAGVVAEGHVLRKFAAHLPAIASRLDRERQQQLVAILSFQVSRVIRSRATNPSHVAHKALALLEASLVLPGTQAWQTEGLALLDKALPLLIASDGGPLATPLPAHLALATDLFQHSADRDAANAQALGPRASASLDRLGPFLGLLLQQDAAFAFAGEHPRLAALLAARQQMTPLAHAPVSGFCRLSHQRLTAITANGHGGEAPALALFLQGQPLLEATLFAALPEHARPAQPPASGITSASAGTLLELQWQAHRREVFLSSTGDDLRVADSWQGTGRRWLVLTLPADVRLSVARHGTSATLALNGRSAWQLSVRGARILPQLDAGLLHLETEECTTAVNWAIKKPLQDSTRRRKEHEPALL